MNEVRMVAIDSSTKKTGMSLFVNGKLEKWRLIDLSAHVRNTDERINMMGADILVLLSHWNPTMVYIEEPKGHGQNLELVRKLSEILGIVRAWTILNHAYYQEVKPSEWRKYAGIQQGKKKRDELKKESIDYVKRIHNLEVGDDVADSICIGTAMLNRYRND